MSEWKPFDHPKSTDAVGAVEVDELLMSLVEETLAIKQELGDQRDIAISLEGVAPAIAALGCPDRAARIWGCAERLREEIGAQLPPNEQLRCDREVSAARSEMDSDAAFNAAWNDGRKLTIDQAISLALEES